MDFDPDASENEDEDEAQEPTIQLSSIEINLLIYQVSSYDRSEWVLADK